MTKNQGADEESDEARAKSPLIAFTSASLTEMLSKNFVPFHFSE